MYIAIGNDDVFALDAKTGALIWEHRSGIDQNINTVCCGWDNRGVAIGDGKVFLGYLDGNVVALDMQDRQGALEDADRALAGRLHHHQRAALPQRRDLHRHLRRRPLRARLSGRARCQDRQGELWRFWTVPAPGEFGSDTWPKPDDPDPKRANAMKVGGATIWQTPAIDPELGLIYFSHRQSRPGSGRHGSRPAGRQPVLLVDRGA